MSLPIRHVILPWTQPLIVPDASSLPAVLEMQKDMLVVSESSESAALKDTPRHGAPTKAPTASSQNPWLELMNQDLPDIPEEHRTLLHEESLIGATIVLDVLTTHSLAIQEDETILGKVAELLMNTAEAVQGNHSDLQALADLLGEPEGNLRQDVGAQLQEQAIESDAMAIPLPVTVANAIRSIEAMSDVAIREATLIIDGQPLIETKQI